MPVFFNEIHYDNTGTDVGEAIEIAGTAGTDLTGWSIVLYNGLPTARTAYATVNLSGVIPDQGNGFGTLTVTGAANWLQNGNTTGTEPDGFALVNASGVVVQFLSYEGSFIAADGPAAGMTSTNIGVFETSTSAVGLSLQLTGSGSDYSDFTWAPSATATFGAFNNNQTFVSAPVPGVLSINDVSVLEGNSGTTQMTFTVTRASGSVGAVSADYAITLDTASASDFAAGTLFSGTVNFAAGQTSATITLDIAGDTAIEPDETLTVTLSNPTGGATISDATGSGTIVNDDSPPPNVFINEIHYDNSGTDIGEAIEIAGVAGTNLAGWSLVLYNGNGGVTYSAAIALSGVIPDQDDGYGTLSFSAAGMQNGPDGVALVSPTGVVQFLSYGGAFVATNGPATGMMSTDIGVVENPAPGAGFSLQLVGSGASYGDFTWRSASDDNFGAVNTGQDFLSATAPGLLSVADVSVAEGDSGDTLVTVTVRRSGGSALSTTVDYALNLDGTANAADLAAGTILSGSLTFAAGVTQQTITFAVAGDVAPETNETLSVALSNATNATILDGTAIITIVNDDPVSAHIYEIQGEGHISAYVNQVVTTSGIVTAIDSNGYYLQDAAGDGNVRTSDGIFVFTGTAPTVAIGDHAEVRGTVSEVLPGGSADNLSITTLNQSNVTILSQGNALPTTLIGTGGLNPPTHVFDDDGFTVYDPANDAADFYESLEGMRVTIDAPLVVSATNSYNETWVVASGGANATGVNSRGGITISDSDNDGLYPDMNPERIQIDDDAGLFAGFTGSFTQGDILSSVTGIMTYDFQNYQLSVTEAVTITQDAGPLSREQTTITSAPDVLTIASYNVENLDPGDNKFDILATDIVYGLGAPDIIGLQEIQDGDGAGSGANLSGYVTAQGLIDAIAAIGGPRYVYIEITPTTANSTGGEPNGNIRNGFLYNADRVNYVTDSAQLITGAAFNGSRNPLVASFEFNSQVVTAISVHSTSRGGSDPLFGATQPPINGGEGSRNAQSQAIAAYVFDLLAGDPARNIAVMGDFNAFYFENSLTTLEQGGLLTNVLRLLPSEERYTYMFDGNAQNLDNMLVTGGLFAGAMADVVHRNAEQADTPARGTDHDPIVASFIVPILVGGTPNADTLVGTPYRDIISGKESDDVLSGLGGNDVIDGGAGADQMYGGDGEDILIVDDAGDLAQGDDGRDLVRSSVTHVLAASSEDITLTGSADIGATGNAYGNIMIGNAGANILDGGIGIDYMYGGAGDDVFIVDHSDDLADGGDGRDLVRASASYTLSATVEDVTLTGAADISATGNALNNVMTGNDGNNHLDGGLGIDTLLGGAGDDIMLVDNVDDVAQGDEGHDLVFSSVSYTLSATTEDIVLYTSANINATGNASDNALYGNEGNNILDGREGADTVYAGAGDDTIYVDNVLDSVDGGEGRDLVYSSVSYNLAPTVEDVTLTGSANINVTGNAYGNVMHGNDGDNIIDGGVGLDYMYGGAGNDTFLVDHTDDLVEGQEGRDLVITSASYRLSDTTEDLQVAGTDNINAIGNAFDNVLLGNSGDNIFWALDGNDRLEGGEGADVLYGGAGADTFVFAANTGRDFIGDFENGIDRIDLSAFGLTFEDLIYRFQQAGEDVWFELPTHEIIVINNIQVSQLDVTDFIL